MPLGVGVGGIIDGPFVVAEPSAGMADPEMGGRTGCTDVVAPGLEGGASEALRVTRTVSLFRGTLEVRDESGVASCFTETGADFRGGNTEPVCFETAWTDEVCRGGGRCDAPACCGFIRETLPVCLGWGAPAGRIGGTLEVGFGAGTLPTCLRSGTLVVNFDGADGTCFKSGTLAVCFEGGAAAGFGGIEDGFSGSLMRLWILGVVQG